MIRMLRGLVADKRAAGMVVDCHGVGYGLEMPLSSLLKLGAIGDEVLVWVTTVLNQDSLRLFGFASREEQEVFEMLIGLSGVGPKLALAVLSMMMPQDLVEAVSRKDCAALVKIPGIGKKKAERLLLDLKDKVLHLSASVQMANSGHKFVGGIGPDIVSALINLGFKDATAEDVAGRVIEEYPSELDPAVLVRAALRMASPRA